MAPVNSQHLILALRWISLNSLYFFLPIVGFTQEIQSEFLQNKYPTFSSEDIKEVGIKKLTIREMRKPSSRPIYDDNIRFSYFFDQEGVLMGYRKTYPSLGGRVDTTSVSKIYMKGVLLAESEKIGRYQRRVTYEYIDSVTTNQTISIKRGEGDWEEFAQEKIVTQKIKNGKVEMIGGLRSEPYQRIVHQYDKKERLTSIETWNGRRVKSIETWTYLDENLTNYQFKDLQDKNKSEYNFPMDWEKDNGVYCNSVECKDWSILTHDNGWPKGWIFMDPKTQDINIWEFDYKYW